MLGTGPCFLLSFCYCPVTAEDIVALCSVCVSWAWSIQVLFYLGPFCISGVGNVFLLSLSCGFLSCILMCLMLSLNFCTFSPNAQILPKNCWFLWRIDVKLNSSFNRCFCLRISFLRYPALPIIYINLISTIRANLS